jgi:hypothetical protein
MMHIFSLIFRGVIEWQDLYHLQSVIYACFLLPNTSLMTVLEAESTAQKRGFYNRGKVVHINSVERGWSELGANEHIY